MNRPGRTAQTKRVAAVAGAASLALLAAALPAAAHPSFASAPTVGFNPNPQGGFGVGNVAPPFGPTTQYTAAFRLPDEVTTLHNGVDDNTVKAVIQIPAGWTNPTCGDARSEINDASTSATNQPGAVVAGWTCAVTTEPGAAGVGDRQFLTWTGPQAATSEASAEFFLFSVTTPTPTTLTRYGALADTATPPTFATGEGFVSTQIYASYAAGPPATGQIRNWYPPNHPLAAGSGNTAGGLVRTVSPTAPPTGTPGNQTVTAVVGGPPAGTFSLSIPNNNAISLTPGAPNPAFHAFTGALNAITVTDTRAGGPGWSMSGQAAAFSPLGGDSAKHLGWTPSIAIPGATAVAGAVVRNFLDPVTSGPGLATSKPLATGASAGTNSGQGSVGAALNLRLPTGIPGGTYTTTLTVTAI